MTTITKSAEKIDAIIIGQSEIVRYEDYSKFPIDRIHLYKDLVFLRMVHLNGQFMSHLDVINLVRSGKTFAQATDDKERRTLLSIWNLPGLSSLLVASAAHHHGFNVKVVGTEILCPNVFALKNDTTSNKSGLFLFNGSLKSVLYCVTISPG